MSSAYDEMTTKILKICASVFSDPLSYIYNHLLCIGMFPDHLNTAVVKPHYMKGEETSVKITGVLHY
jgi:hypothetical protein